MSGVKFASAMAPWFERFVAVKQSQGASYESQIWILKRFDRYLVGRIHDTVEFTSELLAEYLASKTGLAPRSCEKIACTLWPAVDYAARHGAGCSPAPVRPTFPRVDLRKPHIYTEEETDRIICAALALGPEGSLRPHTYATLFALLVTTGLRLGEARQLRISDVQFDRAILEVRKGKFGKTRLIPLHDSTAAGLARYHAMRRRAGYPSTGESFFFVTRKCTTPSQPAVYRAFRTCLRAAGVRDATGRLPRIHDFRHTFAVRRVVAWYRQGIDVNQRLPALATYLGHVDVTYTLVYLQPNGPMLGEAAGRFANSCPISLGEPLEGRP